MRSAPEQYSGDQLSRYLTYSMTFRGGIMDRSVLHLPREIRCQFAEIISKYGKLDCTRHGTNSDRSLLSPLPPATPTKCSSVALGVENRSNVISPWFKRRQNTYTFQETSVSSIDLP